MKNNRFIERFGHLTFYDTTNGLSCPLTAMEVYEETMQNETSDCDEIIYLGYAGKTNVVKLSVNDVFSWADQEHWFTARKGD